MSTASLPAEKSDSLNRTVVQRINHAFANKKKYFLPPAALLAFLYVPAFAFGTNQSASDTTTVTVDQPQPLSADFEFTPHSTVKQADSLPSVGVSGPTQVEVQTNSPANTEVQINGQSIPVPNDGNVQRQVQSEGSTMSVEVYVNNKTTGDTTSQNSINVETQTSSNTHVRQRR